MLLFKNTMLHILNTVKSLNGNKGLEIQILQDVYIIKRLYASNLQNVEKDGIDVQNMLRLAGYAK